VITLFTGTLRVATSAFMALSRFRRAIQPTAPVHGTGQGCRDQGDALAPRSGIAV